MSAAIVVERIYAASLSDIWALWTTREGFESWWGPVGFRAEVCAIEARAGGVLDYEMIADTPEMLAAMQKMGETGTTRCRGRFEVFEPMERLLLVQVIDFLPGVAPYDSRIEVDLRPEGAGRVRMVVTLNPMHDAATSRMQAQGFESQLTKLDERLAP